MNEIPYHKVNHPLSRDRHYSFAKFQDGSVLLVLDGIGMSVTIHLSTSDVEDLKGDFNA